MTYMQEMVMSGAVALHGVRISSPRDNRFRIKRAFDLIVVSLALSVIGPFLLLIALFVQHDGKQILFRHERIGRHGRPFKCLKFRTMVVNADRVLRDLLERDPAAAAEWQATQKLRNDPRITRVGRFLRATSLDEIPQLFNILSGEMTLVGPRPIIRAEVRRYGEKIDHYLSVHPGLTGAWQIAGRSDVSYKRRVELDTHYVENWSFWTDLAILFKTVPVVLFCRGAL